MKVESDKLKRIDEIDKELELKLQEDDIIVI